MNEGRWRGETEGGGDGKRRTEGERREERLERGTEGEGARIWEGVGQQGRVGGEDGRGREEGGKAEGMERRCSGGTGCGTVMGAGVSG